MRTSGRHVGCGRLGSSEPTTGGPPSLSFSFLFSFLADARGACLSPLLLLLLLLHEIVIFMVDLWPFCHRWMALFGCVWQEGHVDRHLLSINTHRQRRAGGLGVGVVTSTGLACVVWVQHQISAISEGKKLGASSLSVLDRRRVRSFLAQKKLLLCILSFLLAPVPAMIEVPKHLFRDATQGPIVCGHGLWCCRLHMLRTVYFLHHFALFCFDPNTEKNSSTLPMPISSAQPHIVYNVGCNRGHHPAVTVPMFGRIATGGEWSDAAPAGKGALSTCKSQQNKTTF